MKLTKRQRVELKQKYGGHCAYCGELLGDKWHADHLAPIYRGYGPEEEIAHRGKDELENMMPACVSCNLSKSVFPLEVWRNELKEKVERLTKYEKNFRLVVAFGQVKITHKPVKFFFETYEICDHELSDWEKLEPEPNLRFRCLDCGNEV